MIARVWKGTNRAEFVFEVLLDERA